MQFSVHVAKTQLSKLIEAALRGEEVVIAKGSQPVVRLVPLPQSRNLIGALEGKVAVPDDLFSPVPHRAPNATPDTTADTTSDGRTGG